MGFVKSAVSATRSVMAMKKSLAACKDAFDTVMRPNNDSTRDQVLEKVLAVSNSKPLFLTEEGSVARTVCDLTWINAAFTTSSCLLYAGLPELALEAAEAASALVADRIPPSSAKGAEMRQDAIRVTLSAKFRTLAAKNPSDPEILSCAHQMEALSESMKTETGETDAKTQGPRPLSDKRASWAGETALAFFLSGNRERSLFHLERAKEFGGLHQLSMETGDSCPVPYRESLPSEYKEMARSLIEAEMSEKQTLSMTKP